jgi:hypothetical protein
MLNLVANGPSGYNLTNSLRFRASASASLSRTVASASNRKTYTWSGWVKRGNLGTNQQIFVAGTAATDFTVFQLTTGDAIILNCTTASTLRISATTSAIFRDPSAWYHIVFAIDTTQATSSNGVKFYVNGVQQSLTISTYTQNIDTGINSTLTQYHGQIFTSQYLDGYLSEVNFVDGQQLTPSSFGSTNSLTGVWQPARYTGTYGTNGFYLKFSNIALTSGSNTGLGQDFSGNGNYWNTNNISVTAGTTYDAMTDVPTLTSATVANYANFSGTNLGTYANSTITEAGLRVSVSAGGTPDGGKAYAPFGMSDGSGKWYFEMTCVDPGATNQRLCFGVANVTTNPNAITITNGYYASASGAHGNFNIGTFTTGDILQVAYDSGTNKLWFGKNNTWYNSGDPVAGTTPTATVTSGVTYVPFSTYASSGGGPGIGAWNFGQRPFSYTPPTGYNRLNTFNLPTSTIVKGNTVMDATLYTGTGATLSVTNAASFKPDLVWIKSRSAATDNKLTDSVRGATKAMISNAQTAETTDLTGLTAFNTNGFTVGASTVYNNTSATYVGWQWQANQGSTVSNTSGSITSTVSVNTTAGFSVATYTGTGANATVGHGLGVAPKMVIVKSRSINPSSWIVWHTVLAGTQYITLEQTAAAATLASIWNSTTPTSSVFSVGTNAATNGSASTYVAYCWAEIAGFSRFGSYTGNGSTDGPFVYTGFRPKFVMTKGSGVVSVWSITDTSRNTSNLANNFLQPNASTAEAATGEVDILSNGFKLRGTNSSWNGSGGAYIYMAFAENPFKNANAR